jgi:PKD repeat protein
MPPHICYSIIVWKPSTHIFLFTVYILYKQFKFPLTIVFTSQSQKVAYFDDVGSTYAIDQTINHLYNDRVANMWRHNVPSYTAHFVPVSFV